MVMSGCLAFGVMTLPTWCVSVVREGKSDGVIVLEREVDGRWHWLNDQATQLDRQSHGHHLCGVSVNGKAQGVKKQEGTHGGCCGCEVAHCGSSTPSKHPSSGASQKQHTHHTCVGFSTYGITH